jgi:hypothetical protein
MYKYWITYHCATFDHTRREYAETDNAFDVLRHYWRIAENNRVLSVDVDGFDQSNFQIGN